MITGDRTGYAHPRCYGGAAEDCSERISREHWLTGSIITAIRNDGTNLVASGLPWLNGKSAQLSVTSMASNILCERHNNSLSSIDAVAEKFFLATRSDQQSLADAEHTERSEDTLVLCQGPILELWMLKLFWGALASKSLGSNGAPVPALRSDIDLRNFTDILWRGAEWPDGWGLYMRRHRVDPHGSPNSIAVQSHSGPDGTLWGGSVVIGALQLCLAFGVADGPHGDFFYRPGGVLFTGKGTSAEKVIALAWPETGHPSIHYERLGDSSGASTAESHGGRLTSVPLAGESPRGATALLGRTPPAALDPGGSADPMAGSPS